MRAMIISALLLLATSAWSADLPKPSFVNENSLLESFPIGKATKEEVYEAYGPPVKTVKGLPYDGETWSYNKGIDSNEFTFVFRGNIAYDVIVRYSSGGFLASDRSARKIQSGK
jgi:hypothetical protein